MWRYTVSKFELHLCQKKKMYILCNYCQHGQYDTCSQRVMAADTPCSYHKVSNVHDHCHCYKIMQNEVCSMGYY